MKIVLLIPIYNDRESLKKLIENINFEVKDLNSEVSVVVINDVYFNAQYLTFLSCNHGRNARPMYKDRESIWRTGSRERCESLFVLFNSVGSGRAILHGSTWVVIR